MRTYVLGYLLVRRVLILPGGGGVYPKDRWLLRWLLRANNEMSPFPILYNNPVIILDDLAYL